MSAATVAANGQTATERFGATSTIIALDTDVSDGVFVPLSVVLELEWVMRGFYERPAEDFCRAVDHLLGMPHVVEERWEQVKDAVDLHRDGLHFADALHWASARASASLATFGARFVRDARRRGRTLTVVTAR